MRAARPAARAPRRPPSNFSGTGGSGYADGPAAASCPASCEANAAGMYLPRSILIGATTRYVAQTSSGRVAIAKEHQRVPARPVGITRAERQHRLEIVSSDLHTCLCSSATPCPRRGNQLPDGPIKLYVCGVTPYDTTHLGHAFTFVQFDTLVRALRWLRPSARSCTSRTSPTSTTRSCTRARKLGVDWRALGDEQTELYRADMRALNVADPTHFVRATSAIPTILHAHRARCSTAARRTSSTAAASFFASRRRPTYGELSQAVARARCSTIAGQQDDADVDDPRKEDPLDFALWKGWSGQRDEPCWDSPWGRGRPGWHIECSALCYQYLGAQLTHPRRRGRSGLPAPRERDRPEREGHAACGRSPQVWSHVAMVRMDGEKMSKSLGNMVFVRELLRTYSAGRDPAVPAGAPLPAGVGVVAGRAGCGRRARRSAASRPRASPTCQRRPTPESPSPTALARRPGHARARSKSCATSERPRRLRELGRVLGLELWTRPRVELTRERSAQRWPVTCMSSRPRSLRPATIAELSVGMDRPASPYHPRFVARQAVPIRGARPAFGTGRDVNRC